MRTNWKESLNGTSITRGVLGRSQSVLVRGENPRASSSVATRRAARDSAALSTPPNDDEDGDEETKRDSKSAGGGGILPKTLNGKVAPSQEGNRGGATASSNGAAQQNGKFQDLYFVYIQQLAERKKKGKEDEQNAQSRAQQVREKLKQKILKQCQETKPKRMWEGAAVVDSTIRLPPLHGSAAPTVVRRSLDDSATPAFVVPPPALGPSYSVSSFSRRSLSQSLSAAPSFTTSTTLSPYMSPAVLTRMATGNALAVGGGVNLVDGTSSHPPYSPPSSALQPPCTHIHSSPFPPLPLLN